MVDPAITGSFQGQLGIHSKREKSAHSPEIAHVRDYTQVRGGYVKWQNQEIFTGLMDQSPELPGRNPD